MSTILNLNTLRGSDNRRTLLLDFAAIIVQAPPDYIIVENVPGLNTAFGKDIYQEFQNILSSHGFETEADMMERKTTVYHKPESGLS